MISNEKSRYIYFLFLKIIVLNYRNNYRFPQLHLIVKPTKYKKIYFKQCSNYFYVNALINIMLTNNT